MVRFQEHEATHGRTGSLSRQDGRGPAVKFKLHAETLNSVLVRARWYAERASRETVARFQRRDVFRVRAIPPTCAA